VGYIVGFWIDILTSIKTTVGMNVQTMRSKGSTPVPPEKGAFPLDHFAECTPKFWEYMHCINDSKYNNTPECRVASMNYLNCRMEKGLMAKEDLTKLGFSDLLKQQQEKIECVSCTQQQQIRVEEIQEIRNMPKPQSSSSN
jgi:cytochrome c oxidase assembly protein subunit 19